MFLEDLAWLYRVLRGRRPLTAYGRGEEVEPGPMGELGKKTALLRPGNSTMLSNVGITHRAYTVSQAIRI
jgi:hypothetical protein